MRFNFFGIGRLLASVLGYSGLKFTGFSMEKGLIVKRLRLMLLLPLAIVIAAIVVAFIFLLYQHERKMFQNSVAKIQASAQSFYTSSIAHDTSALLAISNTMQKIPQLESAFERADKKRLMKVSMPILAKLNGLYDVTHLYYILPNKKVLLRVHQPVRDGDVINRMTMNNSVDSGATSQGVELGPLGTLTLRVVQPWYQASTKQLIGYLELGVEIDGVLRQMRHFFQSKVFVIIDKHHLSQGSWESGMHRLGEHNSWNRFPDFVLASGFNQKLPDIVAKCIASNAQAGECHSYSLSDHKLSYEIVSIPIKDASGHSIAKALILVDLSYNVRSVWRVVYIASSLAFIFYFLMLAFGYWMLGRIGLRIEDDEAQLENLATHDGLTGLLNHRTFHLILEKETQRSSRYGHPLALIMIDIDYFKKVNDSYGHQAGDLILRELAELLKSCTRKADSVCRYGGEEMMIILPETSKEEACLLAERIRTRVEAEKFVASSGGSMRITVSLGLALLSGDKIDSTTLVSAADTALYQAKNNGRNQVCISTMES